MKFKTPSVKKKQLEGDENNIIKKGEFIFYLAK